MNRSDPLAQSYAQCMAIARRAARNFYYGFLLLPPDRRRAMCALYAFMRRSDDLADAPGPAAEKAAALAEWRRHLLAALEEPPEQAMSRHPTLAALGDTVHRFGIPARYLLDVLDGVGMDVEPRVFPTFQDLRGYCYRVASAVGLCCIHIWGYYSENGRAESLAESCGLALQMTNILRDVREDANCGRVYLPLEDLERFGIQPEQLRGPASDDRLRALFAHEAERARAFYHEARPLERLVKPVGRPVLRAIVGIYRNLLDEIVRRDYDVLSRRVALSPWRKAAITLRSICGSAR
jgi:phytoene synthase